MAFRRARKNPFKQINMQFLLDVQSLNEESRRFIWYDLFYEINTRTIMHVYRLTNDLEAKVTNPSELEESTLYTQQVWTKRIRGRNALSDIMWVESNAKYLFVFSALTTKNVPFMFRLMGKGLELRQLE